MKNILLLIKFDGYRCHNTILLPPIFSFCTSDPPLCNVTYCDDDRDNLDYEQVLCEPLGIKRRGLSVLTSFDRKEYR